MIGRLEGAVVHRDPSAGQVILDVNGVGYELRVSMQTMANIAEVGTTCTLFVHTHTAQDQLTLFGFGDLEERAMFRLLTSVPKVGPRNAMAVLGGLPLAELAQCIDADDSTRLTRIPGIGKRTAEQIALTLGGKMVPFLVDAGSPAPTPVDDPRVDRASEALIAMGWKPKPVGKALQAVAGEVDEKASVEELIRAALAELMG